MLALRAAYDAAAVAEHRATYQLELAGEPFAIAVRGEEIDIRPGAAPDADLTLHAAPITLTRLLRGVTRVDDVCAGGRLQVEGDPNRLEDFLAAFALARSNGRTSSS